MQVGNYQNTSYTVPVQNNVPVQQSNTVDNGNLASYPYGQDVFAGQYSGFKNMYSNFDTQVSKFSPFYGKMNTPTNNIPSNNNTPVDNNTNTVTTNNTTIPTTINQTNTNTPVVNAPAVSKKTTPKGPVISNLQDLLQNEVRQITTPQKAVETIAQHAMVSRQERAMANNISWGARFYAKKALEIAQDLEKNKANMNPSQINSQIMNIENLKVKSIGLLNEGKKRAINTYNEALKATMLYNHFFTESGQFTSVLNDNDRKFVEEELDKTWKQWEGGFQKEFQGSVVKADEAPLVIDKSSQEVSNYINNIDSILTKVRPA